TLLPTKPDPAVIWASGRRTWYHAAYAFMVEPPILDSRPPVYSRDPIAATVSSVEFNPTGPLVPAAFEPTLIHWLFTRAAIPSALGKPPAFLKYPATNTLSSSASTPYSTEPVSPNALIEPTADQ